MPTNTSTNVHFNHCLCDPCRVLCHIMSRVHMSDCQVHNQTSPDDPLVCSCDGSPSITDCFRAVD